MNRFLPYIICLVFVAFSGCVREAFIEADEQDEILTKRISVGNEEEFELGLGDTALIEGTEIELTFSFVSSDNRCPEDVVCITAGEGIILLLYSDPFSTSRQVRATIPGLVRTPYVSNEILRHNGNDIVLLRLDPYPNSSVKHSPRDYRALLVVRH